ncbi:MAG: energy transducer TonB [Bacteroidales bacterium]|nr:energy transducer TonB [Bacteroidales bacterium]
MMGFLIYDGKVAVALLVFYLFYRFLLKKETFHRFNRVVLVGTAVLSFILPLCIITIHKPIEMDALAAGQVPTMSTPDLAELPSEGLTPAGEAAAPWWPIALAILFWAGVAVALLRVIISILSIAKIIRNGESIREEDGCKIIITERDIDPFSWMKYIVLSQKDWEGDHTPILLHEKAHIGFGHSIEVLLVDVLSALQWFNPAIWMLRADLQELHEYEADDAVLRAGSNIKEYQYLLIRKAVSKSGYSVANSFNHSILKNRITMMSKSKSPLSRGWRVLYLLPLVCLGLGLQARTVYVPLDKDNEFLSAQEQFNYFLPEVVVTKYADASVNPEDVVHVNRVNEIKMTTGKDFDTAPECCENFARWLNSRLLYPVDCLYDGTLVAMFVVGEDGKVGTVEIVSGLCEEVDNAVASLICKSPEWTPALKDGKPVATVLFQPVRFIIRTAANAKAPVVLNVRADGSLESGGQVYAIAQLKDFVKPQTTVQINAADNVPMGVIQDVKDELRAIGSVRIRYTSPSDQGEEIRNMPPTPSRRINGVNELWPGVKRDNVFVVRINANDKYYFGDAPRQNDAEMLRIGKDFLTKKGKEARFGLQVDRATSYGAYRHMQDLLFQIFSEVREEKALSVYGKSLKDLSPEEKSQINEMVPLAISETDMKRLKRQMRE